MEQNGPKPGSRFKSFSIEDILKSSPTTTQQVSSTFIRHPFMPHLSSLPSPAEMARSSGSFGRGESTAIQPSLSMSQHHLFPHDLDVINSVGSTFNTSQIHPIFAVSPSSGITYSWISPPKSLPRKRTVFTRRQRTELESKFQAQKYISKSERIRFAHELGLKDSQVKVWFINRRTKWRNDREKRNLRATKSSTSSSSSSDISSVASIDRLNHSSSRLI